MTKKLLFGILAAAFLLAACDKKPQPPLVFGAGVWPAYETVYLAGDLGYFAKVNLHLAEYSSETEVEQAFRSHRIQVAAVTLKQALLLRRDIPDLKIILLLDSAGKRMDVLIARDENIGRYHQEMQQLLLGWRRAMDYMKDNPDKAVQFMAKREHLAPAKFSKVLKGIEMYNWARNQQMMMGDPPPAGSAIVSAQRALLNAGKLQVGIDASMLLEPALLIEPKK